MAECQEPITECVGLSTDDDDVHMFILLGKSGTKYILSKRSF
jgi:hypothetical protein